MRAHAYSSFHLGGPEIRGLGFTSVSSGGCIAPGDMGLQVIIALWYPPQAGRQRRPGPLCRPGDVGSLVPSAGQEMEGPWSPLQAGRWISGPGEPGLPLHSAPGPPEPEANTWDPLQHPRDWQPVTPESSRVNTGGVFLCCLHVRVHKRSKAIVKRSKIPPLGKKERNRSPHKQPSAAKNFYSPSNSMQKIHKIFTYNAQYFISKSINISPEETLPVSSSHVWI